MAYFHPQRGIVTDHCRRCGWQVEADDYEDAARAEMFHEDSHTPETCSMCDPSRTHLGNPRHAKACLEAAEEAELEAYRESLG